MRKQPRNNPHKKPVAMAATLMAGGFSALMLTATPASAETTYREALDRCVNALPGRDTLAECVEKIQSTPVVTRRASVPVGVPAPPPTSSGVQADPAAGPGLAGGVTSGADQAIPNAVDTPPVVVPSLPDAKVIQREVDEEVDEEVDQIVDFSGGPLVQRSLAEAPAVEATQESAPVDEGPLDQGPVEHESSDVTPPVESWMLGALSRLRECESNGNYGTNTGNGYYGAYQFSVRTWNSLGLDGYPHQADAAVQDEAAAALQARDGWGQWPACSRRLGLL